MLKTAVKKAVSTRAGWIASAPLRPRGTVVLMYHRVNARDCPFAGAPLDEFVSQMRWLKRHCDPIAPERYLEATRNPSRTRPPVVVTFDDGYRDYHDAAYPVLDELRIPAVVFLATSFIDTQRMIWTDAVAWAFRQSTRDSIALPWPPGERLPLRDAQQRATAERAAKRHLKDVPDAERQAKQQELFAALGVDPEDGAAGRQMLTWDEVRAVRELTDFGGHTHTHPILSQLTNDDADREIGLCRDLIESHTGRAPRTFAYPNGRAQDFTEQTQASLARHGFELGFSTIEGVNDAATDRYAIRRQPTGSRDLADFAWLVSGR
jgi:peptidoglycan/xylan/chitin deacetylase (PgdA/CDA1 family)